MQQNSFDWLEKSYVLLDGAMGTQLQAAGLRAGDCPEALNLTQPALISSIHAAYLQAGSQIIYSNTFGASRRKLSRYDLTPEQVIPAAVTVAREAVAAHRPGASAGSPGAACPLVALDLGPLGELLEPIGQLTFEAAYQAFAEQVQLGAAAGADLISIETLTDLYEAKAALLAARETAPDLPVFLTMSFEANRRTFNGTGVAALAGLAEGLGAAAVGFNCSLGPNELIPHVQELAAHTNLPLIVKANAGLPDPETGVFQVRGEAFAQAMIRLAELGVTLLGGCCGTDPQTIAALWQQLRTRKPPAARPRVCLDTVSSPLRTLSLSGPAIIGERLNPTGKPALQQALQKQDAGYLQSLAVEQTAAGADLLDLNVGVPGLDEVRLLPWAVKVVQAVSDLPLVLDSADPVALEAALRVVNGQAIVNSVNAKATVLATILPLVRKYGAAVIGLTLDDDGIPRTADGRVACAALIRDAVVWHKIPAERLIIDCLTMAVSAEPDAARVTLEALHRVHHELQLHTCLGISNVSFGLPARRQLNQTFLAAALAQGLNLPIINPNHTEMVDTVVNWRVLRQGSAGMAHYLSRFAPAAEPDRPARGPDTAALDTTGQDTAALDTAGHKTAQELAERLGRLIRRGQKSEVPALTAQLLQQLDPLEIMEQVLIPALDAVGADYDSGQAFLPELIRSADAAQLAFLALKEPLAGTGHRSGQGRLLLATVQGDIHDIGKNIVRMLLENYGYEVLDLGRDVSPEHVVQTMLSEDIGLVGLSALMTTTLPAMAETIRQLRKARPEVVIMVGGAVLTPEYAKKIDADHYAANARVNVEIARAYFAQAKDQKEI